MRKWNRYTFRLSGTIVVTAVNEEGAWDDACELVAEGPQDYLELIKVERAPRCWMEKCRLYQSKPAARRLNPAGCIHYEDGICLNTPLRSKNDQ